MKALNINEPSLLETMRTSRESANAVFVKFTTCNRLFNTHTFCFYEGEDGKYYDLRIRNIFKDRVLTYTVGNKKEVIKLLAKIKNDATYDCVNKMFFIDRDYDESLKEIDEDVYETPCYSIENLYANKECFENILQSEFGLNKNDNDFEKCINDFDKRFEEFNQQILEFNALVLWRRRHSNSNSNFKFSNVKTSHLLNVNISTVNKSPKYSQTINNIKTVLSVDDNELKNIIDELNTRNEFVTNFRGKNQLDFMIAIIAHLKSLSNDTQYFKEKLRCIHINVTINRLSELSQYAITPKCLIEFLDYHYEKRIS